MQLIAQGKPQVDAYLEVYKGNCTKKTASRRCSELIKIPECIAYLAVLQEKTEDQHQDIVSKNVEFLQNVRDYDFRKMFNDDGSMKPLHELDDNTATAITGIKYSRLKKLVNGNVEEIIDIKALDALKAAELLGRHVGMFDQNTKTPERAFILHIHI